MFVGPEKQVASPEAELRSGARQQVRRHVIDKSISVGHSFSPCNRENRTLNTRCRSIRFSCLSVYIYLYVSFSLSFSLRTKSCRQYTSKTRVGIAFPFSHWAAYAAVILSRTSVNVSYSTRRHSRRFYGYFLLAPYVQRNSLTTLAYAFRSEIT
jgi:hypothetical protein